MASTLGALASALAGLSRSLLKADAGGAGGGSKDKKGPPPPPAYNPLGGGSANAGSKTKKKKTATKKGPPPPPQYNPLGGGSANAGSKTKKKAAAKGPPPPPAYNPLTGGSANTGSKKKAYVPPPPEARDPWWSPVGRNTNFTRGEADPGPPAQPPYNPLSGGSANTGERRRNTQPKPLDQFVPQPLETYATPPSQVQAEGLDTADLGTQIAPTPTFASTATAQSAIVDPAQSQAEATMQALINIFRSMGAPEEQVQQLEQFVPRQSSPQTQTDAAMIAERNPPVSSMGPNVDFASPVWDGAANLIQRGSDYLAKTGVVDNYLQRLEDRSIQAQVKANQRSEGLPDWLAPSVGQLSYIGGVAPAILDFADAAVDLAGATSIALPDKDFVPEDLRGVTFSASQLMNANLEGAERLNPFSVNYSGGAWGDGETFTDARWDRLREYNKLNQDVANLSAEDRFNARPYWFSLGDPDKARGFVDWVVNRDNEVAFYEQKAAEAQRNGDMLLAAEYGTKAEDVRSTSYYDAWWDAQNQWTYMAMSVLNPLDAFAAVKPITRAFEPVLAKVGLLDDIAYKAKLIQRGTNVSDEVATTIANIQQWRTVFPDALSQEGAAAFVVEDMIKAADKIISNGPGQELFNAFRGFSSRKELFKWLGSQTPQATARRIGDEFTDIFGVVAQGVRTTKEARHLIDAITSGEAFIKTPDPLFWGDFQKDFALIRAMGEDLKSLPALADGVALDTTKVMGELQEAVELNVRRLLGDLPSEFNARATQIKVVKATGTDKGKHLVTYLNANGDIVQTTAPMTKEAAEKLAKEHTDLLGQSLYDSNGALKGFEFGTRIAKQIISTRHMILAPAFSIRNALWSYRRAVEQAATGFRYSDEMIGYIQKLTGGWVLSEDMRGIARGDQAFEQFGNLGEQIFGGKWRADSKIPNPLARAINLGSNITFGESGLKVNAGKFGKWYLPWGEMSQRGNFQDSGFRQMFDYLNSQSSTEFMDELAQLGLDPAQARQIGDIAQDMGRTLSKSELYAALQQSMGGNDTWFNLRGYGINPNQFTGEQLGEVQGILQRHTPGTVDQLEEDLFGFLTRHIDEAIDRAYLDPPQPGSFVDTIQGIADDMGEFTADIQAFAGSLPPGQAEALVEAAQTTATRIIEKETQAWDTMVDALATSGRRIDLQNIGVLWRKLEEEKMRVRMAADRLNRSVVGNPDSRAHQVVREKITDLWRQYETTMDNLVTDFAGRLGEETAEDGATALDYMWEVTERAARFDRDATLATAQKPIPPKAAEFEEEYEQIRNAMRELIDNELDRAIMLFGRYPAMEHLDEIIAAQRDVTRFGMLASHTVNKALKGVGNEVMSYDRYREFSDAIWNGYRSFAEMRIRWASLRGSQMAQGLPRTPAASVGKLYNELDWIMPGIPTSNDLNRMARLANIPTASVTQAVEMSPEQLRAWSKAIDTPGQMFETAYGPAEIVRRMAAGRNNAVRVKVRFEDGSTRIIQGNNIGMPIQKVEDWLRSDPNGEVEKAAKPIAAALNKAKQSAGELRPTTIVLLDGEVVNVSQTISRYGELQSLDGGNVPFYNLNVVQELRYGDEVVWTRPEGYEFPRLVQPSDSRIPVGPEQVKPSPYVNNLLRKYADDIGLSTQTQEAIANVNTPERLWEVLSDTEKRQAFNFLYVRAKDAGADVVRQWYDSKFPNLSEEFFGLTGGMDFFKFMDMTHANTKLGGAVIDVPTAGSGASYEIDLLTDAVAKIIGNAQEILQPQQGLPVPPNLRLGVQGAINNFLRKRDSNIYTARQAGQDFVNQSVFSYNDKYVADQVAGNFMLYHYFQTRALWNFYKRTWREPRQAAQIYRWQRAVAQEYRQQEQQGAPTRVEGTVPFPVRTFAENMGVPDSISRALPNRAYNPIAYLFPLNLINEFEDPSRETGAVAKTYSWMRRLNLINNPMITIPTDFVMDRRDKAMGLNEGGIPRTADYGGYNYLPFSRMIGGLWKSTFAGDDGWQSKFPGAQAGGALPPRWLDSPFSYGLLNRQIMNRATRGDVDSELAAFAYGYLEAERFNLDLPPEYTDDIVEAVKGEIAAATNELGNSQLAREFVRGATGLATQDVPEEEAWIRQFQSVYRSLGYSESNPTGSRAAQNAFLKQQSEELGQPVDDLQRLLYDYPKGYATQPDDVPLSIQALQTAMFNDLQPTYEAETLEIFDALMTGGLTKDGMREIEQKFRDQRDEIYAEYPSLEDYRKETNQPYVYGMNPYEEAQTRLWAKVADINDRKPEWPGEDTEDPVTWYKYYEGMGEWKEGAADSLLMFFEDMQRYDPLPNDSEWKTPAYMGMVGRYPQEIMDAYDFRHDSAPEIVWRIDDRIESELTGSRLQERDDRVMDAFGEEGFRLFKEYKDRTAAMYEEYGDEWWETAPEDAKQEYYDWTNDNPEVKAIDLYAKDPAAYIFVTDRWGEQVFIDNANYPRGGPKGSWKKYAREIGNERWRNLTAYWDWNEDYSYEAYAQLFDEDIAGEFLTYNGQRPLQHPSVMSMGVVEPLGEEKRDEYLTRYYMDKLGSSIDLEEYQRSGKGSSYLSSLVNALPRNIRGELMFEGIPGVTGPPATTPVELPQFLAATGDQAAENYVMSQPGGEALLGIDPSASTQGEAFPIDTQVMRFLEQELGKAELKKLEEEGEKEAAKASSSGGHYSRRYALRYYGRRGYRRRGYRRYYGRRRSYNRYRSRWRSSYGRSGGGYGGGGYGGGGGSSVQLNLDMPRIYPDDPANWLVGGTGNIEAWQPSFMSWSSYLERKPTVDIKFRRLT